MSNSLSKSRTADRTVKQQHGSAAASHPANVRIFGTLPGVLSKPFQALASLSKA